MRLTDDEFKKLKSLASKKDLTQEEKKELDLLTKKKSEKPTGKPNGNMGKKVGDSGK